MTTWTRNTKPEVPCVGDDAPRVCQHRHRRYGMSCAEYAGLVQRADGKCEICDIPGSQTKHGYLVIDHDYAYGFSGGAVRGLLCSTCNTRIAFPIHPEAREATERYLANPWHLQRATAIPRVVAEAVPPPRRRGRQQRPVATPTAEALTAIRMRYTSAITSAEMARAADFRAALDVGHTISEIAEATGYTRETVRRIANPEAAEAIRDARRAKKEQTS